MENEKLVLIDGNSYVHRAYHAIPKLTDSRGNIVNAVFGFMKMLKKIISMENPSHVFVAFDHSKPTFRHKDFKEYKIHREKTEPELIEQFPMVFKILEALNIKFMDCEGFEADDIIATITRIARCEEIAVTIVTSDKDAYQLVRDNVTVADGMKGLKYDECKVEEKFGVKPSHVIDYLALTGDKSDNLPGVRGVGPVTAQKLLREYKDLDGIYKNLNKIKLNIREKLQTYKEDAYITRRLVKLVENVDLSVNMDDCLWKGPDNKKLMQELERLDFKSIVSDWIQADEPEDKDKVEVKIIRKQDELEECLRKNSGKDQVVMELVLNSKTGRLSPENLAGIGIGYDKENFFYIPVGHQYLGVGTQLKWDEVNGAFKNFMPKEKMRFMAYDLKSVYKFFKRQGIKLGDFYFDVITADYILNPRVSEKSLKGICLKYLNRVPDEIDNMPAGEEIEEIAGKVSGRLTAVFELSEILSEKIREHGEEELFKEVELPVLRILAEMELTGIQIDAEEMKRAETEFKQKLKQIENKVFDIAGEKFNINSSKQLARILFGRLGLKPIRKIKTGYSTGEDVLHNLKDRHQLPVEILEYRKLQKLVSTYIEPLPLMIDKETGRIHTTFNITGTVTGRLSSSVPNLQNIPVRTAEGCMIRKTFVPHEGKIFLSADYSQIDLRVLAHICGDRNLIKSFKEGRDIHTLTAVKVFGVDETDVSSDMRKKAKAINFGIVYGMSSRGLSKRADMTEQESKDFIARYFKEYPGIANYIDGTIAKAKEQLFVTTILNRRRYLPEINSSNPMRRRLSERMAINTPVQGSSADIMKIAMQKLDREFHFNDGAVKLLLQIHDELLFEVNDGDINNIKNRIKEKMENAIELSVPVVVDFRKGRNWRDLERIDD